MSLSLLKKIGFLFVAGALIGPVGDYFHVISGTTAYPPEIYGFYFFGLLPYWVPLLFGTATVMIGVSHPVTDRFLPAARKPRPGLSNAKKVAMGLACLVGAYSLSGYLPWKGTVANDLALWTFAVGVWWFFDRSWQGAGMALSTALNGVCVEIFLTHYGVFSYITRDHQMFGVATWLPALYCIASVVVGNLGRLLLRSHLKTSR